MRVFKDDASESDYFIYRSSTTGKLNLKRFQKLMNSLIFFFFCSEWLPWWFAVMRLGSEYSGESVVHHAARHHLCFVRVHVASGDATKCHSIWHWSFDSSWHGTYHLILRDTSTRNNCVAYPVSIVNVFLYLPWRCKLSRLRSKPDAYWKNGVVCVLQLPL